MENDSVRFSRAGDLFHYRWAARRCLNLIKPNSLLQEIVIEGSKESKKSGEYQIDVTEYYGPASDVLNEILYIQLKHTTVRKDNPFNISDLKVTLEGFGSRFKDYKNSIKCGKKPRIRFSIVTNRPVAKSLKDNISKISQKKIVNGRFKRTIEKYTSLNDDLLEQFCKSLDFVDTEGNYEDQRSYLQKEISDLLAGIVDTNVISDMTAFVQEKVVEEVKKPIIREDVLKRFKISNERDLFPAPSKLEILDNPVTRDHSKIISKIISSTAPVIIHAAGGVGKSIFVQQAVQSLPDGSIGLIYDCFGNGSYRNRSQPRHRHRDICTQLSNELAALGYCEPLIPQPSTNPDEYFREFFCRLGKASESLRKINNDALVVIFIDAADNAELVANDYGDIAFPHEIIKESLPEGCRIVVLCRTERLNKLSPTSQVKKIKLSPFSEEETLTNLRNFFPGATKMDGMEFHRLSNKGNPRVQSYALGQHFRSISETLEYLGPEGSTVDEQINSQLELAIQKLKESLPGNQGDYIDSICQALAILPPLIPIEVLATIAGVEESAIESFVADLKQPLWLSSNHVQFRDEPSETWFKATFIATEEQLVSFINHAKPLADSQVYVAMALPSLLLNAKDYDELIKVALSDDFLPDSNPIDARNVRMYRLQFAFRAALRLKDYFEAMRIALRAGEEMAGNERQIKLIKENLDLITILYDDQKIQELAFNHEIKGEWEGSENIFASSLLSSVEQFKGESRAYLRSAEKWLQIFFEDRDKIEDEYQKPRLEDGDVLEFIFSIYNLYGIHKAVQYLLGWSPPSIIYKIGRRFLSRLIDRGSIDEVLEAVNKFSCQDPKKTQYFVIAATEKLLTAGYYPNKNILDYCLTLINGCHTRIPKPNYSFNDTTRSAILAFLESCLAVRLSKQRIKNALDFYFPERATTSVIRSFQAEERQLFLRALGLRSIISNNLNPDYEDYSPEKSASGDNYSNGQEFREFKEILDGLLPWYLLRILLIIDKVKNFSQILNDADQKLKTIQQVRIKESDFLPFDISKIMLEVLIFIPDKFIDEKKEFYSKYIKNNNKIRLDDRLEAIRNLYRKNSQSQIGNDFELLTFKFIDSLTNETPETKADFYINLTRAVLSIDHDDAVAYFDEAINAVSKFGDELVSRWEAIASLADQSSRNSKYNDELTYRFFRCAELVGDNVVGEKYFDRYGVVKIGAKLSPNIAISVVSRWQDRNVGRFDQIISSLAFELVNSNVISSSVGWSLSPFFNVFYLDGYASLCIEKETVQNKQQYILDSVIHDIRIFNNSREKINNLKEISESFSLDGSRLDEVFTFYEHLSYEDKQNIQNQDIENIKEQKIDWNSIFKELEPISLNSIKRSLELYKSVSSIYQNRDLFWRELFNRINITHVYKLLMIVLEISKIGIYEFQTIVKNIPEKWWEKASVQKNRPSLIKKIFYRFALDLTKKYLFDEFYRDLRIKSSEEGLIIDQISKYLAENPNFYNSSVLFGFVEITSPFITDEQAAKLLDYGISRFEVHIEDDYADGPWIDELKPPQNIIEVFARFIWTTLGSPFAKTRWQAVHCVRRLIEQKCYSEIDSLLQCIQIKKCSSIWE